MKKKVVTAFMMVALGSSLVFSQAVMAADTTAKTETSEDADKDATESEDKDVAEDADKADEEKEDLKTIGEKPEEDTEGVFSVKLKNLTGKVITGVTVKNEKDEEYPDNFLKEEDKFEADEERVLWFDPNAEVKADGNTEEKNQDAAEKTEAAGEDKTETANADEKSDKKPEDENKDEDEKEIPKYDIQLTFEDGTTAELHTFPFGDTEEAELHLEDEVAYLIFDSISQKKEYNTLETEKALAPKPTEAPAAASQSTQSYDNSSDYDYSYDYSNDSNDSYDYSNDYDYSYDNSDYDYDYSGSDDSDYSGSDDSGSGYDGSDDSGSGDGGSDDGGSDDGGSGDGGSDDGGNGCLDDGLLN